MKPGKIIKVFQKIGNYEGWIEPSEKFVNGWVKDGALPQGQNLPETRFFSLIINISVGLKIKHCLLAGWMG